MANRTYGFLLLLAMRAAVLVLCTIAGAILAGAIGLAVGGGVLWFGLGVLAGLLGGVLGAVYGLRRYGKIVGAGLAIAYLLLSTVFLAPALFPDSSSDPSFAGVPAIVLTSPWSGIAISVADSIDPTLLNSIFFSVGLLSVCALVNAALLFLLGILLSLVGKAHGT